MAWPLPPPCAYLGAASACRRPLSVPGPWEGRCRREGGRVARFVLRGLHGETGGPCGLAPLPWAVFLWELTPGAGGLLTRDRLGPTPSS